MIERRIQVTTTTGEATTNTPVTENTTLIESSEPRARTISALRTALDLITYNDPISLTGVRRLPLPDEVSLEKTRQFISDTKLHKGKSTTISSWTDNSIQTTYTIEEGIPIDAVLRQLKEISNISTELTDPKELQKILKAEELLAILNDYSFPFEELHSQMDEGEFSKLRKAIIEREAKNLRESGRLNDPNQALIIAEKLVADRIELRLPPDFAYEESKTQKRASLFTKPPVTTDTSSNNTRRLGVLKKLAEAGGYIGLTTIPEAIFIDNFGHQPIAATAGAATVFALSSFIESRKAKKNGNTYLSEKNKRKDAIRNVGVNTAATLASGFITPDFLIFTLDQLPTKTADYIKGAAGTAWIAGSWLGRNRLKALKNKESKTPIEKQTPQGIESDNPNDFSKAVIRGSISYLLNKELRLENIKKSLYGKVSKKIGSELEEIKETEEILAQTYLSTHGSIEEQSLARYFGLYTFLKHTNSYNDKKPDLGKGIIVEQAHLSIKKLDKLAQKAIPAENINSLTTTELDEFQEHSEDGHGLAYLINLCQNSESERHIELLNQIENTVQKTIANSVDTKEKVEELINKLRKDLINKKANGLKDVLIDILGESTVQGVNKLPSSLKRFLR